MVFSIPPLPQLLLSFYSGSLFSVLTGEYRWENGSTSQGIDGARCEKNQLSTLAKSHSCGLNWGNGRWQYMNRGMDSESQRKEKHRPLSKKPEPLDWWYVQNYYKVFNVYFDPSGAFISAVSESVLSLLLVGNVVMDNVLLLSGPQCPFLYVEKI